MKGTHIKRLSALLLLLAMLVSLAACGKEETPIEKTARYLQAQIPEPTCAAVGGDWLVFGLARSGLKVPQKYFDTYFKNVEDYIVSVDGVLSRKKNTEYSRVILALTAIGKNPADAAGFNLLLPLVLSPLAGFGVGFLIMWLIYWIFARVMRSKVNRIFRKMQLVSAAFMATSHGLNDAQKTMGIITLALFIFGEIDEVAVPLWVKLACAMAMAAGTAIGGWKIVKTMGHRIFKLEPVHGFAAETSAALVISGASVLGAPVSTTHTISACIFGVGSTKRLSAVRWTVAGQLVTAWVLTLPAAATVGFCSYWLLHLIWN